MEKLFAGNQYQTADSRRPSLLSRLLPGRVPFYLRALAIVRFANSAAKRHEFDDQAFFECGARMLKAVEDCGGRWDISGFDNLEKLDGPAVFAGNHMSLLETFVLPSMIVPHGPVSFVIKESLSRTPGLVAIMREQKSIVVGRTNPREDFKTVMKEGGDFLSSGRSVTIFPQGTRDVDFVASEFNTIALKLASRNKVPLVPIALKTDFLENGRWLKDCGPVHKEKTIYFSFGEPIFDLSDSREAHRLCLEFLQTKLSEWGVACRD